ncbi:MAG: TfoX/Sxy family protein [Chloroflexi bacterium]|nr:TfoX/Sxy family protein [Chloroflexota bacterium]
MEATNETVRECVVMQLSPLGPVWARAMFGGYGLYCDSLFFGLIAHGRLYLKVDDASRADCIAQGLEPFRPSTGQTMRGYYEAPGAVIGDPAVLLAWAARSVEVARHAAATHRPVAARNREADRATGSGAGLTRQAGVTLRTP